MRVYLSIAMPLVILLVGCANPINLHNAEKYWNAGYAAQQSGNWTDARMYYNRSIVNLELGNADRRTLAVLWYEYGRASGVLCDWAEAEQALAKAHYYDRLADGPIYMSSYELARMHYDRSEFGEAERYFARAYDEFESAGIDTRDPIGYAIFLEEYVDTLGRIGKSDQAAHYLERAEAIRSAFPKGESHTEKTPYGTQCAPSE